MEKSGRNCSHCGCSDIDVDPARGDAVCTNCGAVLESQIIVSEVQFEKDSHAVIGTFVADDEGGGASSFRPGYFGTGEMSNTDYRETTFRNARHRLAQMATSLRIKQHCVEMAFNMYKMCYFRGLTRSRKQDLILATVLYIVCRLESTPHMMIDFSDILQVNVYILGYYFQQITRALYINTPVLDPAIYISRFAERLQLGDKINEVTMLAVRIVQRMKRDWICTGRRPAGLCGAALLVSSRYHGFNRVPLDIIKCLRIGRNTLEKRLQELAETESASLTMDQFSSINLEGEADPPSFTASRKRTKQQQQSKVTEVGSTDGTAICKENEWLIKLVGEANQLEDQVTEQIESWQERRARVFLKQFGAFEDADASTKVEPKVEQPETAGTVNESAASDGLHAASNSSSLPPNVSDNRPLSTEPPQLPKTRSKNGTSLLGDDDEDEDVDVEQSEKNLIDILQRQDDNAEGADNVEEENTDTGEASALGSYRCRQMASTSGQSMIEVGRMLGDRLLGVTFGASLGLRETFDNCFGAASDPVPPTSSEVESEQLDLTGIDDNEIDEYILSKDEADLKKALWYKANADYLKKKSERDELKRQQMEQQKTSSKRRRRKTPGTGKKRAKGGAGGAADSSQIDGQLSDAEDGAADVRSSKINYEHLAATDGSKTQSKSKPDPSVDHSKSQPILKASSPNRFALRGPLFAATAKPNAVGSKPESLVAVRSNMEASSGPKEGTNETSKGGGNNIFAVASATRRSSRVAVNTLAGAAGASVPTSGSSSTADSAVPSSGSALSASALLPRASANVGALLSKSRLRPTIASRASKPQP